MLFFIMTAIESAIASPANVHLLDFSTANNLHEFSLVASPEILGSRYINETLSVGTPGTLKFSLLEKTNKNKDRNYTVEVYTEQDGIEYLKDRFDVTIPAGESAVQVERQISFFRPKNVETTIKVYDPATFRVLDDDRLDSKSVTSTWHITVILGDRAYGYRNYPIWSVQTIDGNGWGDLFIDEVLGKSVSGASPLVHNGDTPTGYYTGYIGPVQDSEYSYGPHEVLMMNGYYGDIKESGRTGIWIHGGDPSTNPKATTYPLRPTYGCIRLSNDNQLLLINAIHGYIDDGANTVGQIDVMEAVE